jgi:hypothetical protein
VAPAAVRLMRQAFHPEYGARHASQFAASRKYASRDVYTTDAASTTSTRTTLTDAMTARIATRILGRARPATQKIDSGAITYPPAIPTASPRDEFDTASAAQSQTKELTPTHVHPSTVPRRDGLELVAALTAQV